MFKNYYLTAIRNIIKSKIFSFINIAGFAAGICVVMLILYYIQFHLSFDNYHEKSSRLYRVSIIQERKGIEEEFQAFLPTMGPEMQKDFPEIENFTRVREAAEGTFKNNNITYNISNIAWVDSSFFSLFSLKLLEGNKSSCLLNANQIVLAKTEAVKIFGRDNPVGKIILNGDNESFTVTGVFEDTPKNSELKFNALISMSSLYNKYNPNFWTWNGGNQFVTYLLLKNNISPKTIEDKIPAFMWKNINERFSPLGIKFKPYLKPIGSMHMSPGLKTNMYIFSIIAALILLLASINFINLNNSKSLKRNIEIGVRKVMGAERKDIILQFLLESFVMIIASTILAVILCALVLPAFNQFAGENFSFADILDMKLLVAAGITILITGILASLYPSFVLSSFKPVKIFRKETDYIKGRISLRGVLVVFQFVISIALITVTALINSQLDYINNKDLGFDKENQLVVQLTGKQVIAQSEIIKNELSKIGGVVNASLSTDVPGTGVTRNGYRIKDIPELLLLHFLGTDADFLSTYNIEVIQGRGFIKGELSEQNSCLINEALARKYNLKNPVGMEINRDGIYKVVGVVKDFNFSPVYKEVAPLIITNNQMEQPFRMITLKIKSSNIASVLNSVKDIYTKFADGQPPLYSFVNEDIDKVYAPAVTFRSMFLYFSSIAFIIALMGISGLTLLTVVQKKKEIAIRKVLGANIKQVSFKVVRKFILWILLSNLIAWPIAYYVIEYFLQDFAYKVFVSPVYFLAASLLTLFITAIIIGIMTIKAAIANPVDSLRSE